jgi:hypothetical protein
MLGSEHDDTVRYDVVAVEAGQLVHESSQEHCTPASLTMTQHTRPVHEGAEKKVEWLATQLHRPLRRSHPKVRHAQEPSPPSEKAPLEQQNDGLLLDGPQLTSFGSLPAKAAHAQVLSVVELHDVSGAGSFSSLDPPLPPPVARSPLDAPPDVPPPAPPLPPSPSPLPRSPMPLPPSLELPEPANEAQRPSTHRDGNAHCPGSHGWPFASARRHV